jgi:hypothetical protein
MIKQLRDVLSTQLQTVKLEMGEDPSTPGTAILSNTFRLGDKATVHCALPRDYWTELLNMLDFKLESQEATRRRRLITANEERIDYRERNLYLLHPGRRVAKRQYFEDGLILPFGADRRTFTEANLHVLFHTISNQG